MAGVSSLEDHTPGDKFIVLTMIKNVGVFCITSIWSTPKNAGNHGKQIRRVVDNCTKHISIDNSGEEEE